MKRFFYIITILFILVIFGFGCKKYVAGPKGEAGVNGLNGNSNQQHTIPFKVLSSAWDSVDVTTRIEWQTVISDEDVDDNVIQSGEVNVYVLVDGSWFQLPYINNFLSTQFGMSKGQIKLFHAHIHGGTPGRPVTTQYRVVVVEPKI